MAVMAMAAMMVAFFIVVVFCLIVLSLAAKVQIIGETANMLADYLAFCMIMFNFAIMKRHFLWLLLPFLVSCSSWRHFDGEHQTFGPSAVTVASSWQFHDRNIMTPELVKAIGVEPIENREAANRLVRRLNLIADTRYYRLDPMEYSIPYLADGAERLLKDIGKRFQKKLRKRGFREHRIIVTSVLRTRDDVRRLVKVNGNASKNSAHMYATTFDLAYTRFDRISMKGNAVNNETMANILGEVLAELREKERCRVIFERQQRCFHVMSNR